MPTFYEYCKNLEATDTSYSVSLGDDAPYSAVARIVCFDGDWSGFLVFKDTLLSPTEDHLDGRIQFKYHTPSAGNGVVAEARARMYWKTLVDIFEGLQQSHD